MKRPGLDRLLADVAAGRIDIILIYKIDRLTRSLTDFAKIVDVLDKADASFVSVTQSFNTTTSMGRLTLNMLLSFAQFEREVIGGDTQQLQAIIAAGDLMAAVLRSGSNHDRLVRMSAIAPRVMLDVDRVSITLNPKLLFAALGHPVEDIDYQPIVLTCDAVRMRRGHELRLVIPSPKAPPPAQRNEKLVALIAEGRAARKLLLDQPNLPLARIAADAGRCRTRLAKLAVVGCLAPDIVTAIVEGRQPATLDHNTLMAGDLPLDWAAQRAMLGIGLAVSTAVKKMPA